MQALARNIRPVAIDFALHASNEWTSADWAAKSAEAAQISVAIATLKSIASGGRQPSPEEVKAAVATAPVRAQAGPHPPPVFSTLSSLQPPHTARRPHAHRLSLPSPSAPRRRQVLAYEPSPARAEEMTYNPAGSEPTASSATVKPFSD